MDKAFDVVFQSEVDATVIAKTLYRMNGERFRYQCLCCGEEVYLVAADSVKRTPHFRHRQGNNDIECERYLGQPGVIETCVSIRRERNKERVGFCFNIDRLTFETSLSLSKEEIDSYSRKQAKLHLYLKYNSSPFFSIPINRNVFRPNSANYFTINEYSNDYYSSIDGGSMKFSYPEVIRKEGKLNIYKVNQQDEHYRKITSGLLYTDTEYMAITESKRNIEQLIALQGLKINGDELFINTMSKTFFAIKFVIKDATHNLKVYFNSHDYWLEELEEFDILWPPVISKDDVVTTCENTVYVKSSFEMIPHGNIDTDENNIDNIERDVYKISVDDKVSIHEKNVDVVIVKEKQKTLDECKEEPQISYIDKFIVPDKYEYFRFDNDGCTKLISGSTVYLSAEDRIIGYKNGHVKAYIYPKDSKLLSVEERINDIIKYHPQTEAFNYDDFMDIDTNETILNYLETCYRSGVINSVVKRFIMEKRF